MTSLDKINEILCYIKDSTTCKLRYVEPKTRADSEQIIVKNVKHVQSPSITSIYNDDHFGKTFGIYSYDTWKCEVIKLEDKSNMIHCQK